MTDGTNDTVLPQKKGTVMNTFIKRSLSLLIFLALIISLVPYVSAQDDLDLLYGRSALSQMIKGDTFAEAYDRIVDGVENRNESVDLSDLNLTETELDWIVTAYRNDPHGHFWNVDSYWYGIYSSGKIASYIPMYTSLGLASDEDFALYKKSFDDACTSIIKKAKISQSSSDYVKAKNLHDILIKHITYTKSGNAQNEYGALVEGLCVCQGYTLSYQYLLRLMGVMAYSVVGIANGGGHSWNLVRIDGEYYYTDVTWDDANNSKADDTEIYYSFFNVTTVELSRDHYWTDPVYGLPKCTSTKASYYTTNTDYVFSDSFTAENFANLVNDGFARIYVPGGDMNAFSAWFSDNFYDIALECNYDMTQDISVSFNYKGEELHVFINGTLNDPYYYIIPGDIDGDGRLSAIDSNILKRIISGVHTATIEQLVAGDIDNSGSLTGIDSNLLVRMVAGM